MAKHHKPVEQSRKNRNLQKDVKEISEKNNNFSTAQEQTATEYSEKY